MSPLVLTMPPGLEDEPDEAGTPEYVLTIPIPDQEAEGEYAFITVAPDGRTVAVMVDSVTADDRTVSGYIDNRLLVKIPKEAPWVLLQRNLTKFVSRAELQKRAGNPLARLGLLGLGGGGEGCPVHGSPAQAEPVLDENGQLRKTDPSTGQYL